jgi:alcohol dehydrogenase (cytochrome c)
VFATSGLLGPAVLSQAPAQAPPAAGPAPPAVPPAAGRGGEGGRGGGRGALTPFAKEALAALRAPLDRLTPVTDAMLRNPSPGDWLHWRRTYDGWAHSPLNQINRDTVKDLRVAWTWSLHSGPAAVNEFTPLVHDGVMFMWNFGETIQALDARTGTLLCGSTPTSCQPITRRCRASSERSGASRLAPTS